MNYLLNSKMSLVLVAACLYSCEIVDNHGSTRSQPGELIGKYYPQSEIFINEKRQELYFITADQSYENLSIIALNYETKEVSTLYKHNAYDSHTSLVHNQVIDQRLLFVISRYSGNGQTTVLHEIDLDTRNHREILINTINEYSIVANQDYVFYNNEYQFIYKSDFDGNTVFLPISGELLYAIPGTNQIIIRNNLNTKEEYSIYDYALDSVILQKDNVNYYVDRFYANNDELYFSDFNRIVNFKTDAVLYNLSGHVNFMDFNPASYKTLLLDFDNSNLFTPELIIADLKGNSPESVILYGWHLGFAKILNDGKTVIYHVGQDFYKISTE